jgi:hypothetical protein
MSYGPEIQANLLEGGAGGQRSRPTQLDHLTEPCRCPRGVHPCQPNTILEQPARLRLRCAVGEPADPVYEARSPERILPRKRDDESVPGLSRVALSHQRVREDHRFRYAARAGESEQQLWHRAPTLDSIQRGQRLLVPSRMPQGPGPLKPRFTAPAGVLAVQYLGKSVIGCRHVPQAHMATAACQPRVLPKLHAHVGNGDPSQWGERLLTLT